MEISNPVSFRKYYIYFSIALFGLTVLISVISAFLDSGTPTVLSMITPSFAGQIIVERFVKNQKRAPDKSEQSRLATGCILATLAIELLALLPALTVGNIGSETQNIGMNMAVFFGVAIVVLAVKLLLNYALLRWTFGSVARKRAKKLGYSPADAFD